MPELALNRLMNGAEGDRGHLVLQMLQLMNVRLRQKVPAQGENLGEFHEDNAQILEGFAHFDRGRPMLLSAQSAQYAMT
jgi:hypothetical protein